MRHEKISSEGVEYTLLTDKRNGGLIGIEILCDKESGVKTRRFVEKFPDLINEAGWKVNYWGNGIAFAANTGRMEVAIPKKDLSALKLLFDKAKLEKRLVLVPIYGVLPGFQLIAAED